MEYLFAWVHLMLIMAELIPKKQSFVYLLIRRSDSHAANHNPQQLRLNEETTLGYARKCDSMVAMGLFRRQIPGASA
jgi:hypothetical protein